ncbi:MAG: sigma-70 family RNA polymerase sigma factor [Verrucomicrobiota bacterium]|nr:sigma-70 family RNA polymerase sigma factor [Verrucomicrobiota bacterium]
MFAVRVFIEPTLILAGHDCGGRRALPKRMSDETNGETDAQLLQLVARGDHMAFGRLYDRFCRPLFSMALRILGDVRETEDVVQEAFISLWEKSSTFAADRGTAFSWAVTLTRNRAIDRLRRRKRRSELLDNAAPADLGYETDAGAGDYALPLDLQEKARQVRSALAVLPAEQKRALELAFFSGLTQQQISEQLSEPLGTVKARIRRGLLKLRDALRSDHD